MTLRIIPWTLIIALAGILAGCSRTAAPTASVSQSVAGMAVTLTTSPPAHTGDNTFVVTLADAQTQAPIGNANITVTPEMLSPRLPGAPTSGRAQGNGVYNLPVRLGVATRYNIVLEIERPGRAKTEVSFPVEAAQ